MSIHRVNDMLRWLSVLALAASVAFMVAPTSTNVAPVVIDAPVDDISMDATARSRADSLTADIILYNLFASSRSAPSQRSTATGSATGQDAEMSSVNGSEYSSGFRPELLGT